MTSKIFALEQRIMNCWNVVDDLDDLYYYFGDDPFFKDMDAKHQDKICNLLLGMKEMYQIKFQKCIFDFEDVCKEYHSRNKRHDHETGEDWPDEDRMDIIGQNGNNGEHYESEHIEIDRLMRINPELTYPQVRILRKSFPKTDIEYSPEKLLDGICELIEKSAVDDYDEGLAVVKYWLSMES